jgi:flap endonuclease-1
LTRWLKTSAEDIRTAAGPLTEIREIFLNPEVTDDYRIEYGRPDVDAVLRFLCDDREFSRDRVQAALERAFGK